MKIAVIGAGVAGLSAAWLLSRRHDVTLFEAAHRLGGHANTVAAVCPEGPVAIDTGFIVYNTACYPNLIALFDHLGVATAPASMSFAVSLDAGRIEYNGSGISGLFGQPARLVDPDHWRMLRDLFRFFRTADAFSRNVEASDVSLGAWLAAEGFSQAFVERHILPMGAAIWSTPAAGILDFPAAAFARFFANHGLLQATRRPEWRTVRGGSRTYVEALSRRLSGAVVTGDPVVAIRRAPAAVSVATRSGTAANFDRCLLACHADQALALLADADAHERRLLGAMRYTMNHAVLHRDPGHMPRRRRLWSSWNYLAHTRDDLARDDLARDDLARDDLAGDDLARDDLAGDAAARETAVSVTYWMNKLQPLATRTDHFVTLNPLAPIHDEDVVARFDYAHPLYDAAALAAQRDLWGLQGRNRTWFAGSYFGFGFHEDALQSGLAAAEHLGDVRRPWRVDGERSRLQTRPPLADTSVAIAAE